MEVAGGAEWGHVEGRGKVTSSLGAAFHHPEPQQHEKRVNCWVLSGVLNPQSNTVAAGTRASPRRQSTAWPWVLAKIRLAQGAPKSSQVHHQAEEVPFLPVQCMEGPPAPMGQPAEVWTRGLLWKRVPAVQ